MDDVKLINCVKRYPEVYDPKNIDFKCTDRKELFWTEISRELCNSVDECKKRWRAIRERFTRELKRNHLEPGRISNYVYFDLMDTFLSDHIRHRSLDNKGDIIITKQSPKLVTSYQWDYHNETNNDDVAEPEEVLLESSNEEDNFYNTEKNESTCGVDADVEILPDYPTSSNVSVKANNDRRTEIEENAAFGQSIGIDLSKLSRVNNIRAKVEIYQIIQKFMEIEEEEQDSKPREKRKKFN